MEPSEVEERSSGPRLAAYCLPCERLSATRARRPRSHTIRRLPAVGAFGVPAAIGALLDRHLTLRGPGNERFEPVINER